MSSMVTAGRLVEERGIGEHHGCYDHRWGCTIVITFDGPDVRETMSTARALVQRYQQSSQTALWLQQCLEFQYKFQHKFQHKDKVKVIRDGETRWWFTKGTYKMYIQYLQYACLARLVYLRTANAPNARIGRLRCSAVYPASRARLRPALGRR